MDVELGLKQLVRYEPAALDLLGAVDSALGEDDPGLRYAAVAADP
ncbi:hypothetical protein [Streptomyces sp. NPDC056938]